MLKTGMLELICCALASWREKFMGRWRVAAVSRKGAKAQRRFPGLQSGVGFFRRTGLPAVPPTVAR